MKNTFCGKKNILPEKKVCAVHDISCAGRCSLTVVLPVLSAGGIECNVIPTAVLSTHTGGFEGYTFRDLSEDILPVAEHWNSLGRTFDAVYTGFFGSAEQIRDAEKLPELLGRKTEDGKKDYTVMIDPVMADCGKLYSGFDNAFADEMRRYCESADIIVPNMTEAALLLSEEYCEGPHEGSKIRKMLENLTQMGPEQAVITGVCSEKGKKGVAAFNRTTGEYAEIMKEEIPGVYYGTGDLFASGLLAGLLNGKNLAEAAKISLNLIYKSIERTYRLKEDVRYGVDFEPFLGSFAKNFKF